MPRKSKSAAAPFDIDAACDSLIELGVKRRQFIKARIQVMNAAGALVRRALGWQPDLPEQEQASINKIAAKIIGAENASELSADHAAIAEALRFDIATSKAMAEPGERHQANVEKEMRKIARQFPVWQWAEGINGLSDLGLAVIISQAGNLAKYSTPDKLKKRLGLSPITKDGVTRAASEWRKGGLTSEEWKDTGPSGPKYSPKRRAQMYAQVGTMIIGGMGKGVRPLVGEDISLRDDWSYYQKEFVRRLRHEVARDPAMGRPNTKDGKESFSLHARFRAQRVVEQRLLRDLWKAWRRAIASLSEATIEGMPAAEISNGEAEGKLPSSAICDVPPPESAKVEVPIGLAMIADSTFSDTPQGVGEATRKLPARAEAKMPPHQSSEAA